MAKLKPHTHPPNTITIAAQQQQQQHQHLLSFNSFHTFVYRSDQLPYQCEIKPCRLYSSQQFWSLAQMCGRALLRFLQPRLVSSNPGVAAADRWMCGNIPGNDVMLHLYTHRHIDGSEAQTHRQCFQIRLSSLFYNLCNLSASKHSCITHTNDTDTGAAGINGATAAA